MTQHHHQPARPRVAITPVKGSSNVSGFGYDAASKTLAVQFPSGVYHFAGVSPETFAAFQGAESKGRFFAGVIRGKYDSTRIDDGPGMHVEPRHGE